ncbi:MAG: alpha-glycosidase [Lachnospiraceae bacterium]|nr:alpha-glycosidase [Lachnospiraceae bacterium]
MNNWLESVYSDGSKEFVSKQIPSLGDKVSVFLRLYEDAPVKHIFLRYLRNGAENLVEMKPEKTQNHLTYYKGEMPVTEKRMQYRFYLVCDDIVYYYTQGQITSYIPEGSTDFVLLADIKQPEWVRNAVFYQIFPERFCNGDPSNDVQDGEYEFNGHKTIHMKDWSDEALPYDKGFCLDFYGGDLQGVEAKIPYLKKLGVTAVYLNPIFSAPSNHKYDCVDFFHVDKHFGGDEALASLSKALHDNGMKLILDISINHTGSNHKWFNKYGTFFDKSVGAYNNPDSEERDFYFFEKDSNEYLGWAGVKELPTLNYTSEKLRDIIFGGEDSVLKKWLKPPYSIDGWRFDVADVFARNDDVQLNRELWPLINKSIKDVNPEAYILAEDWGDVATYLNGYEWDSAMNYFGCSRIIRQVLGESDLFNERNDILKSLNLKMTAEDFKGALMQHLSHIPFIMWQNQFNLIDSHDVTRLANNPEITFDMYRGAVILQFILIGTPSIYYGDEAGIGGVVGTNEGCRFPMPWQEDFEKGKHYELYSTLAKTRTASKALTEGGMKVLSASDYVVSIARFYEDQVAIAVVSENDNPCEVEIPVGVVGACGRIPAQDIFGNKLDFTENSGNRSIKLKVPAKGAYFILV